MRCTRNRQLRKINSLMASSFTLTIEDSKKHIWNDKLDPTFKWYREEGCISFSEDIFGRTSVTEVTIQKKEPMKFF